MGLGIWAGVSIGSALFDPGAASFFAGLITSWLVMKVMNFITLIIIQGFVYKWDFQECLREAQSTAVTFQAQSTALKDTAGVTDDMEKKMVKIIATPPTHFGRYYDTPFYEWLDIQSPSGEIKRFMFTGTMDMKQGKTFKIPDDGILFPPGILYQVDKSVNIET
jgi:hypothetical protein